MFPWAKGGTQFGAFITFSCNRCFHTWMWWEKHKKCPEQLKTNSFYSFKSWIVGEAVNKMLILPRFIIIIIISILSVLFFPVIKGQCREGMQQTWYGNTHECVCLWFSFSIFFGCQQTLPLVTKPKDPCVVFTLSELIRDEVRESLDSPKSQMLEKQRCRLCARRPPPMLQTM